jgi:hypothetical protein
VRAGRNRNGEHRKGVVHEVGEAHDRCVGKCGWWQVTHGRPPVFDPKVFFSHPGSNHQPPPHFSTIIGRKKFCLTMF